MYILAANFHASLTFECMFMILHPLYNYLPISLDPFMTTSINMCSLSSIRGYFWGRVLGPADDSVRS